ncbi:MAG: GIY-YIG nuclease family protein [Flavobacteriales bacterium]|nr:GIY-YIG nuclease family protein [Flavobacteriales bacterium]
MKNYNNEPFISTDLNLLKELDSISEKLHKNMITEGKSFIVKDILDKKKFNSFWDFEPHDENKYTKKEYKGIYAFASVTNGIVNFKYIGISQTIKRRFNAHTKRTTRQEASWAYLMIKKDLVEKTLKERESYIPIYQKEKIYPLRFTFFPIEDNMLLHIAEVYCVNKLHSYWNSFETH